jgi:hypothetical protein
MSRVAKERKGKGMKGDVVVKGQRKLMEQLRKARKKGELVWVRPTVFPQINALCCWRHIMYQMPLCIVKFS